MPIEFSPEILWFLATLLQFDKVKMVSWTNLNIQMEFIELCVAVQLGNFIWMRIGVAVDKIQVRTFHVAAILHMNETQNSMKCETKWKHNMHTEFSIDKTNAEIRWKSINLHLDRTIESYHGFQEIVSDYQP